MIYLVAFIIVLAVLKFDWQNSKTMGWKFWGIVFAVLAVFLVGMYIYYTNDTGDSAPRGVVSN